VKLAFYLLSLGNDISDEVTKPSIRPELSDQVKMSCQVVLDMSIFKYKTGYDVLWPQAPTSPVVSCT